MRKIMPRRRQTLSVTPTSTSTSSSSFSARPLSSAPVGSAANASSTTLPSIAEARKRAFSAPLLSSPLGKPQAPPSTTVAVDTYAESQETGNAFERKLPRELRIRIFQALLELHVEEHERVVREGRWKGPEAKKRWVGEEKARREIVRLSRVSKSWQSLAHDGQLWSSFPCGIVAPDSVPPLSFLQRFFASAGPFIRTLDLRGMAHFDDETMGKLIDAARAEDGGTSFERVDLSGCLGLTSVAISELFRQSPRLLSVSLPGLPTITQSTLAQIGASCPHLLSIDVSRCPRLPFSALLHLPTTLRSLRASKPRHVSDALFVALARRLVVLEELDLSYAGPLLTDAAFLDLVTQPPSSSAPDRHRTIELLPSQMGSWSQGLTRKYVLPWRRLNLSSCTGLTDRALHHLSHAVPRLQVLEIARMGGGLHSAGVVALLETTKGIRKVDLEAAVGVDDEVLVALTPPPGGSPLEIGRIPGEALDTLVVSACTGLTDDALARLVARCPNLKRLEADGTQISEITSRRLVEKWLRKGEGGALLSVLDARFQAKRLAAHGCVRPRAGRLGYWAMPFGYHEKDERSVVDVEDQLEECREEDVVVRSFAGHSQVDKASAARKAARHAEISRAVKIQALKELRRRREGDDATHGACLVM
ncbi:hypothetical protein MNV49_006215 [Pseudohyphozyma bogoriensis]|nr:hypothetical protein MNV49_006215 [Pseudohyphozyma bogoriensis]